ncbi:hypothetical protein HPB48_026079 [Haemaphysalis longicornis]|uniref:Uncharacterized protein n=1 Tax=Haemaphysalis longicornis TaxID=44386 RepID=A0A9J6H077_HAELO|nr:hypothetical protein HPB48_026079 [Haemaphysalis longicornis]
MHHALRFFILDAVHLIKSIRMIWLNKRNIVKCMYFHDVKCTYAEPKILTAPFKVLGQLHEAGKNELNTYLESTEPFKH